MNLKENDSLTGCLCSIGCAVLYGLSYSVIKQATETAGPFVILGWRYLTAFVFMTLLSAFGVVKLRFRGKNIRPLLVIALFCPVLYFIGETYGVSMATTSESGVIIACIPVATLIMSALILKKKPMGKEITGILITLAGVLTTVFAASISYSFSVPGYALLFLAVISYAVYSVLVTNVTEFSGMEITYAMLAAGSAVFVCFALAEGIADHSLMRIVTLPFRNGGFLIAVIYTGLGCSILAFFLSNMAIKKIGANRMSSFAGISTVISILVGVLFLHEAFSFWQAVGAVVILAGVYIANSAS